MVKIEKTADEINEIFEIIRVVYDPTCLSFDPIDTIITNFNQALNLAIKIDFSCIREELHNVLSDSDDVQDVIRMALYSFEPIFNWKEDTLEIPRIKESQLNDLVPYFQKLNHLGVSYSPQKKQIITELFIKLGLRLLKARLDLEKIIEELARIDEIKKEIDSLNRGKIAEYNLCLNPDKIQEFTRVLFNLYNNNYFLPLDNKTPISEVDLIMAFENYLDVDISGNEWYGPEFYSQEDNIVPTPALQTSKPALAISPAQIRNELNAYFTESAYDYFLEALRDEFKNEKGKTIAILLYTLQNSNPAILHIPHGKMKKFYTLLKAFFNTNIGTYQSIVNFSVNKNTHKEEIKAIQNRVDKMDLPF
jgi:hypothetical protein